MARRRRWNLPIAMSPNAVSFLGSWCPDGRVGDHYQSLASVRGRGVLQWGGAAAERAKSKDRGGLQQKQISHAMLLSRMPLPNGSATSEAGRRSTTDHSLLPTRYSQPLRAGWPMGYRRANSMTSAGRSISQWCSAAHLARMAAYRFPWPGRGCVCSSRGMLLRSGELRCHRPRPRTRQTLGKWVWSGLVWCDAVLTSTTAAAWLNESQTFDGGR